jgi:site-specific recombinase XerD
MVVTADLATRLEAVKDAVWRAGIQTRAPCHTLRDPLARHLLKDGAEGWWRDGQRRISTV